MKKMRLGIICSGVLLLGLSVANAGTIINPAPTNQVKVCCYNQKGKGESLIFKSAIQQEEDYNYDQKDSSGSHLYVWCTSGGLCKQKLACPSGQVLGEIETRILNEQVASVGRTYHQYVRYARCYKIKRVCEVVNAKETCPEAKATQP